MNERTTSEILKLTNVHTFYGQSHIIQGISLFINDKECVTYLGRNGAGKTTTLKTIMGIVPPREGKIVFKNRPIHSLKPFAISRAGISYVPEERRIFSTLNVKENLNIAKQQRPGKNMWNIDTVFATFPVLRSRRNHRGNQLSGGEQQMLAIARALMGNPEILLLDEPTQGLAPLIIETVLETIARIKRQGITILMVEQNVDATYEITNRYYILQQGLIVYTGTIEEFRGQPELKEKYLGV